MNRTLLTAATLTTLASAAGIVAAQRTWTADQPLPQPPPRQEPSRPAIGGGTGPFTPNLGPRTGPRRGGRLESSYPPRPTDLSDRKGVIEWVIDPNFKKDLFTFARVHWNSYRFTDAWLTDFPDSDLNFSFRLQQLTSLKVDPNPVRVKLTDKELFDYPFIYMIEVSTLTFLDEEIEPLRRYLTNGGFLMVDDFWGDAGWNAFKSEMARVLPDIEPVELDLSHPIFHCVFDLKEKPQVPGIEFAVPRKGTGITSETRDGDGLPHYYAYIDKKGRMMAIVCHNTDLGDGWEREAEDPWYFEEFSVSKGYPMGVNIVFYAMTH